MTETVLVHATLVHELEVEREEGESDEALCERVRLGVQSGDWSLSPGSCVDASVERVEVRKEGR